ncbi:hypothetical protein BDFB_005035 [Asbolus verrucosus]|uniref:Uncharacterized protein n=1 Tax=Asbolus verrucosus TaxID=1661398 RepID=A0A482VKW5_ASBVE|nr:hypothetical protein BDFB_005035 [Asbolus verrucosus]
MSTVVLLENFKRHFNVNADIGDIKFKKFNVEPYHPLEQDRQFGEKKCLLYHSDFVAFNVEISLKILSFTYESHAEVLKLEINVHNELLSREMAPCKNFLQRKRNMNLVFEVLIKYAKFFEMRRIICRTVLQKQANVITVADDKGVVVKFFNEDFSARYLEFTWTITWNVDNYEVSDFIEFYCNYLVLKRQSGDKIKEKLEMLVRPDVDFHSKFKLWRLLVQDLYGCESSLQKPRVTTPVSDVMEILDSDSDESLIEIDRNIYAGPINDEILVIE